MPRTNGGKASAGKARGFTAQVYRQANTAAVPTTIAPPNINSHRTDRRGGKGVNDMLRTRPTQERLDIETGASKRASMFFFCGNHHTRDRVSEIRRPKKLDEKYLVT
jgi:hypothetical protein